MKISVFTHFTNPELRNDPLDEALKCYSSLGDELVTVGENWPYEFKWETIGHVFQEGFDKCSGDWVINMPIDYIFHENDFARIKEKLLEYKNFPAIAFPQHQIFTPDRYFMQSKLCIALNKKKFPEIKLNGGNDLCLPTLNNKRIMPEDVPQTNIPIWNYDKVFGTRETISNDRARFARAWYSQFNDWGIFGGPSPEEAFNAWFEVMELRLRKHVNKLNLDQHPIFLKEKLANLTKEQFGYDCFGLVHSVKPGIKDYLKGYRDKFMQQRYN
jgi:hypothetical protein